MLFFNNFKVSIDPVGGVMTLEEIDLDSVEGVYGGLNEDTWRRRFLQIRYRQKRLDQQIAQVPSSYTVIIEKLQKEREYWDGQLDQLEDRAQRAGVPHAWRE